MTSILGFTIILAAVVIGLVLLTGAASAFGVDSRPTIGDDHAR